MHDRFAGDRAERLTGQQRADQMARLPHGFEVACVVF